MPTDPLTQGAIEARAKAAWDAERAKLRIANPNWEMPAWSRAPSWRRHPYLLDAAAAPKFGDAS